MIGGMPDETKDEKLAREEREEALDAGLAVTYGGMVMQVRPDGLYIDGVKAEAGEPPSKAQALRELEARRVPTRARETDHQRRGKTGEHRGLQVPTTPISTGAGALTVKDACCTPARSATTAAGPPTRGGSTSPASTPAAPSPSPGPIPYQS